jgi:hypothetical protein
MNIKAGIALVMLLAAMILFNSCNPDRNYAVSFRNNSAFQLDSLVLDHMNGQYIFSLAPNETSQIFQLEAYNFGLLERRNTCFGFTVGSYSDAISTFINFQGCGLCLEERNLDPLGFNNIIINAPQNRDFDCSEFFFELDVL